MISKRDAHIAMELVSGRTLREVAFEHGLHPSRIDQIKQKVVMRSGFRVPDPGYAWNTFYTRWTTREPTLPELGARLRRLTHPTPLDPDSPEGFVLGGEIRTNRRPDWA